MLNWFVFIDLLLIQIARQLAIILKFSLLMCCDNHVLQVLDLIFQVNVGDYAAKAVSFLARNFYNLKYLALILAFCINFLLLFYKVSNLSSEFINNSHNTTKYFIKIAPKLNWIWNIDQTITSNKTWREIQLCKLTSRDSFFCGIQSNMEPRIWPLKICQKCTKNWPEILQAIWNGWSDLWILTHRWNWMNFFTGYKRDGGRGRRGC